MDNKIIKNISVSDFAAEGKSIARVDGKVIFIDNAVPGDIVDLIIFKEKKNFSEAKVGNFIKYSPDRVDAVCEHFGICGGCRWQNLDYKAQLIFKQKQVEDNFQRIAKMEIPEVLTIIPSDEVYFYRNKLEFSFSNYRFLTKEDDLIDRDSKNLSGLGFHIKKHFDKVLDIKKCYLQKEPSNDIRQFIKEYAQKNNLEFFDIRKGEGFSRTLIIRTSNLGEVMVILAFYYENKENIEKLLNNLNEKFPDITSLNYVINGKKNDTISDLEIIAYRGKSYITEQMGDLKFKIGPKSFFQTNSKQALKMYEKVKEFAGIKNNEVVYDLYTGTGTIANFIAAQAIKVIGIEYLDTAIEDAKENSKINKIENTYFYSGDVLKILNDEFIINNGAPDIIITDPPRAGMHPKVVEQIKKISSNKIIYVSCDAATQARDIALLADSYEIVKIQPIDMFPHTHHIENIVLLEKKNQ
ncbi:MAG: 23S rRNA (uracil(1939)-C(5))-methyltransferase RlmD [Bacteroidales bacterium]|jgi:23S rRNA (uracil1939-C5)-methyltransferase